MKLITDFMVSFYLIYQVSWRDLVLIIYPNDPKYILTIDKIWYRLITGYNFYRILSV